MVQAASSSAPRPATHNTGADPAHSGGNSRAVSAGAGRIGGTVAACGIGEFAGSDLDFATSASSWSARSTTTPSIASWMLRS